MINQLQLDQKLSKTEDCSLNIVLINHCVQHGISINEVLCSNTTSHTVSKNRRRWFSWLMVCISLSAASAIFSQQSQTKARFTTPRSAYININGLWTWKGFIKLLNTYILVNAMYMCIFQYVIRRMIWFALTFISNNMYWCLIVLSSSKINFSFSKISNFVFNFLF